jgi:hypothetical protein
MSQKPDSAGGQGAFGHDSKQTAVQIEKFCSQECHIRRASLIFHHTKSYCLVFSKNNEGRPNPEAGNRSWIGFSRFWPKFKKNDLRSMYDNWIERLNKVIETGGNLSQGDITRFDIYSELGEQTEVQNVFITWTSRSGELKSREIRSTSWARIEIRETTDYEKFSVLILSSRHSERPHSNLNRWHIKDRRGDLENATRTISEAF